jgi:ferrous iron transport protein B
VPPTYLLGFINIQGLALLALYIFGVLTALISAWILKKLIHLNDKSYFILELPTYRKVRWGHVLLTMKDKAQDFVWQAGKIIFIVSIVIWAMGSVGNWTINGTPTPTQADVKMENSLIGYLGKTIEPAIKPLGYDWKIGVALITSLIAREVFVGTMNTLYPSNINDNTTQSLHSILIQAKNQNGTPIYTIATCISLLIFFALAMQCISTFSIVKKETNSWQWAIAQLAGMTLLAYILSLIAYQTLHYYGF